ncbi:MAG TPA: helix-turn-helix transcriptional regulator [Bryobacteraceae bacterium]|nr:helix-turn-helix transcriptional regulator [Bryobacteraceae bacterium]
MKKFGATIRRLREEKGISLRKFAESVKVSPTYQSKIERDELPPPGEDTVRRMAMALEQDEDELLGLAGKVSSDLDEIIKARPQLMANFLRTLKTVPEDKLRKIQKDLEKAR